MADDVRLGLLKQGAERWNAWRNTWRVDHADLRPDLPEADLRGADLRHASLHGVDLRAVDLREADLSEANLSGADLSEADLRAVDLSGADLWWADLSGANLRGASLHGAQLREAQLREANLSEADLRRAQLQWADLSRADLSRADLSGANLHRANLSRVTLVETNLCAATLSDCAVYGLCAWNVQLEGAAQANLAINAPGEPTITVDNLEVAQVLYLLLHTTTLRDVIEPLTSTVVLILGHFTPQRQTVLDALRAGLRLHHYLPVLFELGGSERPDWSETVTLLASMARFIIADLTDLASSARDVQAIAPAVAVPVQPLISEDAEPLAMVGDHRRCPWLLPIYHYSSLEDLLATLDEQVIAPAEAKAREVRQLRQAQGDSRALCT
jgi:uncharacterized protein YjbI with pentapeptide repeats